MLRFGLKLSLVSVHFKPIQTIQFTRGSHNHVLHVKPTHNVIALHSFEYFGMIKRGALMLGQYASSRLDLLPRPLCNALSKLQSRISPHSLNATRSILFNEFGLEIDDLFDDFDPIPVGVGAVAQVYKAKLKGRQDTVAVKVVHPLARDLISIDLSLLKGFAWLVSVTFPSTEWISIPEQASIFEQMMNDQLDMTHEASHLLQFESNFKHWKGTVFPKAYPNQTTHMVLIEEFIDGIPMTQVLSLGPSVFDSQIATMGLSSFLKMLILDNYVHADLHPGNMLLTFGKRGSTLKQDRIHPNEMNTLRSVSSSSEWQSRLFELKNKGYEPILVMLDTGLVSNLSPRHLTNFLDLFWAVSEFNGRRISQLMIERSSTPWTVIDPTGFSNSMTTFISNIRDQTLSFKHISVSEILGFVLNASREHHVKMDGAYVNVAISIMLLEGMGQRLDPDTDLIKASVPFLRQVMIPTTFWSNLFK